MASDRNGNTHRVVLIDTNGFLNSGRFCLDIFDEVIAQLGACSFVIIPEIEDELRGLGSGNGKDAAASRFALQLLKRCAVLHAEELSGSVDDKIVRVAQAHRCYVVTNDRELKKRLLDQDVPVIVVRGKKKLEIIKR